MHHILKWEVESQKKFFLIKLLTLIFRIIMLLLLTWEGDAKASNGFSGSFETDSFLRFFVAIDGIGSGVTEGLTVIVLDVFLNTIFSGDFDDVKTLVSDFDSLIFLYFSFPFSSPDISLYSNFLEISYSSSCCNSCSLSKGVVKSSEES